MPKLTYDCPLCGKDLKLKEETLLGAERLFTYTCGHAFSRDISKPDKSKLDFGSADGSGKKARPYQEEGVEFIIESDFNAIVADQMRLGKTPQALLALKNAHKERTPCLILVRSANLWQWIREYKVWCDTLPNGIFPILGSNAWIPPGFSSYIVSMDTFARPKVLESLKAIKFKLIIADEAHSFKNTESNRSQALVDFVSHQNSGERMLDLNFTCSRCKHEWIEKGTAKYDKRIGHVMLRKSSQCPSCTQYCYMQQQHSEKDDMQGEKPCGLILLTGTPILNRADEYFVPLNLVNPERFSSLRGFQNAWLEQDSKGRYSRVKKYYIDEFKRTIAPNLIRREKEDVFKELPSINRIFTLIEPEKDTYSKQYNKILDKLDAKLAEKANPSYWDVVDDLMELRRICGMMKLMWTSDYLEACAMESSAKYAIGIHHQAVRDVLYMKLGGEQNAYKLSGEDSAEQKDRIMREWESSTRQFLIINMLAGGVGMDFHYCDNVLVLERQWNAATEEQFEFRFYNPDITINPRPTQIEYIIAKGTIDQMLYDMVEEKRRIFGEIVATHFNLENEPIGTFRGLVEKTVAGRL